MTSANGATGTNTPGALDDLVVLECAQGISGPFCGKALADLGADVLKLEPPGGDSSRADGPFRRDQPDPEGSGRFLYLNTNKRSACLDPERDRDTLADLVRRADVLLLDLPPSRLEALALRWEDLRALNSQLVMTSITPYGLTGPYREYVGTDLTAFHGGGMGRETPYNQVTRLEEEPPLLGGGFQSQYLAGWTAMAATLAALAYRDANGVGQLVDVSVQEAVASMLRVSLAGVAYTGRIVIPREKNGFSWVQPCADGYVSLSPFNFDHWFERFRTMAGEPDWAAEEVFSSTLDRLRNADVLELLLQQWLAERSKAEVYELALKHGVPGFPVHNMREVFGAEQFREREFFVDVEHPCAGRVRQPGPPARYTATPWRIRRPAPRLDEHGAEVPRRLTQPPRPALASPREPSRLPLEGVRVADFGWILAVPHATAWLGSLGAEVIRIESQARLDLVRVLPGTAADDEIGVNRAGAFNGLSYSKKSVTLNLSQPRGCELARALIAECDIVTENFTPGVMERLRLDYAALREIKPDLIMLSGSPLGQTGPQRGATGWGPNTQAFAGLPYLTGYADGPPVGLGGFYPDFMVGVAMASAMLAALRHRARTGEGQHVDFAMAETVASMIPDALLDYEFNGREPERRGNRHPAMVPHGVYRCRGEDKWVAISVRGDADWRRVREALGDPEWARARDFDGLAGRLASRDEIDRQLEAWTRERSHYEVMHHLQAHGVPAAACLDALELVSDPQLVERGFMVEIPHPEVGARAVAGLPGRFSAMGDYDYGPAPCLGQHNREILGGLLGLSAAELEQLETERVVF